jgi:flagellar motility protein MotE (MotC chaperone)
MGCSESREDAKKSKQPKTIGEKCGAAYASSADCCFRSKQNVVKSYKKMKDDKVQAELEKVGRAAA